MTQPPEQTPPPYPTEPPAVRIHAKYRMADSTLRRLSVDFGFDATPEVIMSVVDKLAAVGTGASVTVTRKESDVLCHFNVRVGAGLGGHVHDCGEPAEHNQQSNTPAMRRKHRCLACGMVYTAEDAIGYLASMPLSAADTDAQMPQPTCTAALELTPGGHRHICRLPVAHPPAEPDGREHRCGCGGLFATDAETPAPPGRSTREDIRPTGTGRRGSR